MELVQMKCVPREAGSPPLPKAEAQSLLKQLDGWVITDDGKCIIRTFKMADFATAMRFANDIAAIAEHEGHHPDLAVSWGRVTVELATHAIRGLSENDFIVAAKIDKLQKH